MSKALEFMEDSFRAATDYRSKVPVVAERQIAATELLGRSQFPTNKDEDWKYFDFNDVILSAVKNPHAVIMKEGSFALRAQDDNTQLIATHVFPETVKNLLVTYNGQFKPELSTLESPKGLHILDFNDPNQINAESQKILAKYFASDINDETNVFKIINTCLMQNGFLLYVEDGVAVETPLQILHISNQNTFNQMRSLIYLGKNSQLKISVSDAGLEGKSYLSNTVVEVQLNAGARLKLDKIQDESKQATRLYDLSVKQERDSYFEFNGFSFGAKSSRDDIEVRLLEQGAEASISGLYVVNGDRKSHHKVTVYHESANTKSEQLFKGLLDDSSKAEFNGLIDIGLDCPQVSAAQLNSNLLLSPDAHIDSRPQLNILSDDVKANHGSSTGQLDEDQLFYLQSRGLSLDEAKIVITYSFCREIINKVELESARDYISKLAVKNLSTSLKADLDNRSVIKQCLITSHPEQSEGSH